MMAIWGSDGPKHVAIKFWKTKYIIVFDSNYKQSVYLVRCLLALNMCKIVTYFKIARTAGKPSDIQTGFLRNKSLERFE
jgi:hypothetical protein